MSLTQHEIYEAISTAERACNYAEEVERLRQQVLSDEISLSQLGARVVALGEHGLWTSMVGPRLRRLADEAIALAPTLAVLVADLADVIGDLPETCPFCAYMYKEHHAGCRVPDLLARVAALDESRQT